MSPDGDFVARVAFDDGHSTLNVGPKGGADLSYDSTLVAVGNRDLFAGGQHRPIPLFLDT